MARLDSVHKRFVVKRLAVFDRPSEVRDALRERFGLEVDLSQLAHYDPTNEKGKHLAADLKTLFEETRTGFLEEQKGITIAYKSKRLRELEKMFFRLDGLRDTLPEQRAGERADIEREMRDVLELVEKITGGHYTDRQKHELMGEGGGPVETQDASPKIFLPAKDDGASDQPDTNAGSSARGSDSPDTDPSADE